MLSLSNGINLCSPYFIFRKTLHPQSAFFSANELPKIVHSSENSLEVSQKTDRNETFMNKIFPKIC